MNKARFPMEYLRVTQGYGFYLDGTVKNTYSHTGSWTLDLGGRDTGRDALYCPFDAKVIRTRYNANGELYIESLEPVLWADGTQDYAKIVFLHGENFYYNEGDTIPFGAFFYEEGGMGGGVPGAFADHVHIECGRGRWRNAVQYRNDYGVYIIEDQVPTHTMLWLGPDVEILNSGDYPWQVDLPANDIITVSKTGLLNYGNWNLRTIPDLSATPLGVLNREVNLVEQTADGEFYRIEGGEWINRQAFSSLK